MGRQGLSLEQHNVIKISNIGVPWKTYPGFPFGHSKYILFWKSNYKMQQLFTCNCNKQKIWNELLNISNSTLFMMYVYMYMESFLEQSNLF